MTPEVPATPTRHAGLAPVLFRLPRRWLPGVALGLALSASTIPANADTGIIAAALAAAEATVTIDVLIPAYDHFDRTTVILRESYGSGFFVAPGYIVTNAHVVANAAYIEIVLSDGTHLIAELVGADPVSDIAVVRVDDTAETFLAFADAPPELGEEVAAIGSPYRFDGSVSTGIVSGLDRSLRPSSPNWFVQHTAPINPGSSGSPVINAAGEVIAVNTATPDGQLWFGGIALAVSGLVAEQIVGTLIATGSVEHAEIGATFRAIDTALALALGLTGGGGALVESVSEGGPAALAGLRADDLVLAFNGTPLSSLEDFVTALALAPASDPIELAVIRAGETMTLAIDPEPTPVPPPVQYSPGVVGITMATGAGGLVAAVLPGSLAAAAGLEPGDVIHSINLEPVADGTTAQLLLDSQSGLIAIRVSREGGPDRVVVLGADQSNNGHFVGNDAGNLRAVL